MIKRAFTLLLTSLMAVSVMAADITGRITLSFTGTNNYELLIDGKRYNGNSNRMYLNDLRPGRHTIQVYAMQRASRRNNRPVHSATFIVRPQYDMHIAIDRNGYVHFDETRLRNRNDRDDRYDRNDRSDRNRNWNDDSDRDWNNRDDRYSNDGNWQGNEKRWENSRAMSDYDYNELIQRVRSQWVGSSKYNTAKEAVTRNYFSTGQVRGLMELLSSESQQLELAKLAYRNTVDAQNYTQLYSLFSRNAQIDLDQYIKSNRY